MAKHKKMKKKKKTLLDKFLAFRKKYTEDDDILTFLAIASTDYAWKIKDGLKKKDKKELLEFYNYFWENYDYMEEAIVNEWLIGPPIFQLADKLKDDAYEEEYDSYLSEATSDDWGEAFNLANAILRLKMECYIYVFTNRKLSSNSLDMEIPKPEDMECPDEIKDNLHEVLTAMIVSKGVAYIRTENGNKLELFGIKVSNDGKWRPMPKEEVIKNLYTSADGVVQEPDENTIITEFKWI